MASPPQHRDLDDLGMARPDPGEAPPTMIHLRAISEALQAINLALQQVGQTDADAPSPGADVGAAGPRILPGAAG